MTKKVEMIFLFLCFLGAFYLRLQASLNVPYASDETLKIRVAKEINLKNFELPLGNEETHNGPLLLYVMKASMSLLGENRMGVRLPSLIYSLLTLWLLYVLVKESLDQRTAMLSLILLSLSQLHIGFTRIVDENGFLIFFVVLTLLFIQKALHAGQKRYIFFAGLSLGMGSLVKGTMLTILPGILLYLWLYKGHRHPFSGRDILLFLITCGLVVSPSVYWDMTHGYTDFKYHLDKSGFFAFSFISLALFLGELFIWNLHYIDEISLSQIVSYEYPFCNWLMGLICLAGATYFLNNRKNGFTDLLLWIFWSNFIFFSLVRSNSGGGAAFHLDNFWWAIVAVIPGFILGGAFLADLCRRYKPVRYFILPLILIYFGINGISFVRFPALCWIPNDRVKILELSKTAQKYREEGLREEALKVEQYIQGRYYGL